MISISLLSSVCCSSNCFAKTRAHSSDKIRPDKLRQVLWEESHTCERLSAAAGAAADAENATWGGSASTRARLFTDLDFDWQLIRPSCLLALCRKGRFEKDKQRGESRQTSGGRGQLLHTREDVKLARTCLNLTAWVCSSVFVFLCIWGEEM